VTHRFEIGDAPAAYELIEKRSESYLAVQLTYPKAPAEDAPVVIVRRSSSASPAPAGPSSATSSSASSSGASLPGVGWIGAGAFSTGTLLPAFRRAGFKRLVAVTSASGLTARRIGERFRFEKAVSGSFPVIDDPDVSVVVIATPHDSHAELSALALKDGLALTLDELGEVETAWEASERQLMIGFNRRWSPAVRVARNWIAEMSGPKFLVYRVAAGPVPDGHWYTDRRQGGRILGEVCHFIDTAQALIGAEIVETVSVLADADHGRGGGDGRTVPGNDAVVSLRFSDGSLATICYGSAWPSAGKEWVEIMSGSHRMVINDFRSAHLDGKTLWRGRQDKGHRACASAFKQGINGNLALPTKEMLATTQATIEAATGHHGLGSLFESLERGEE